MQLLEALHVDLDAIFKHLILGLELFGPYADWLWVIPAIWVVTAMSLWFYMMRQQREADRAYLAYASRNLSLLRRLAKQRAREVSFPRRYDRW
jgi:hypothetical protein